MNTNATVFILIQISLIRTENEQSIGKNVDEFMNSKSFQSAENSNTQQGLIYVIMKVWKSTICFTTKNQVI